MARVSSHKRHVQLALMGVICNAFHVRIGYGFLPQTTRIRSPSAWLTLNTAQHSQKRTHSYNDSSPSTSSMWKHQTARLTHEEQYDLLRKVTESRRIKQVKQDLQLASTTRSVTDLQVARATGYGDALDEVEDAVDAGDAAREQLITSNMGLVHFCVNDIVKKRKLQSITKDDLVQEGSIGLARAVDRWNFAAAHDGTSKFSTYAVYWIRAAVLRCIAERDDLVRVPEHVSTAIAKISSAAQTLGISLDPAQHYDPAGAAWKEATAAKALAEMAGLTDKQLREAMKVRDRRNGGMLSFESWMQLGKDYESDLVSVSADNVNSGHLDAAVDSEYMKKTLSRFLRPREMEAVSWRYGLNTAETESTTTTAASVASTSQLLAKRDYVAHAEAELFGDTDASHGQEALASTVAATALPTTPPLPPVRGKWGESMSFTEVGTRMHISAEYGRRLCHAALEKLRRAAEEGILEPAFLG